MSKTSARRFTFQNALAYGFAFLMTFLILGPLAGAAFAQDDDIPPLAEPNFGEGQYGRDRQAMAALIHRLNTLNNELYYFYVDTTYCSQQELDAVRNEFNQIAAENKQLQADYKALKGSMEKNAQGGRRTLTGYDLQSMTPDNPNYFFTTDRLFQAAQKAVDTKAKELAAAKVIDCTLPPPPPPPPPPEDHRTVPVVHVIPQVDPLAGLTRPPFSYQLPPQAPVFCS